MNKVGKKVVRSMVKPAISASTLPAPKRSLSSPPLTRHKGLGASRRRLRVDHACQGANVCSAELNGPVVTNNSSIKLILSK